jgi:hypothetical protein
LEPWEKRCHALADVLDFHKIINTEEKRRGVESLGEVAMGKLTQSSSYTVLTSCMSKMCSSRLRIETTVSTRTKCHIDAIPSRNGMSAPHFFPPALRPRIAASPLLMSQKPLDAKRRAETRWTRKR